MTFHNPGYLFLLLLLIPIIYWYIKEMHKAMQVCKFLHYKI
jgi:hypothetical protein